MIVEAFLATSAHARLGWKVTTPPMLVCTKYCSNIGVLKFEHLIRQQGTKSLPLSILSMLTAQRCTLMTCAAAKKEKKLKKKYRNTYNGMREMSIKSVTTDNRDKRDDTHLWSIRLPIRKHTMYINCAHFFCLCLQKEA